MNTNTMMLISFQIKVTKAVFSKTKKKLHFSTIISKNETKAPTISISPLDVPDVKASSKLIHCQWADQWPRSEDEA